MAEFFNNATIAGMVTVLFGAFTARAIYREQKNIDRQYAAEDKMAEKLLLLEEHCKAVNQIIDRLANTYILITKESDVDATNVFQTKSLPSELTTAAELLMYRLPEDVSKIETIASLYFHENDKVKSAIREVLNDFKKWHDFVQNYATGKTGFPFDLNKRVRDVPELSLDELNKRIKDVLKCFQKR